MLVSLKYLDREKLQHPEYYILMLLATLGLLQRVIRHRVKQPLTEVYKPGTPIRGQYAGGDMALNTKVFTPSGTFSAIDVATGKIAWQVKNERPYFSGVVATAGGLVFHGDRLADIERGDLVGHAVAERQVLPLALGHGARAQLPFAGQQRLASDCGSPRPAQL